MKKSNIAYIPQWALFGRIISDILFHPFFPRVIIDEMNTLKKVRKAAQSGKGLVIVFTHFSLRDAMEANRSIIFADPILRKRKAVNPLAFHQYNKPLALLGKVYCCIAAPIVNNSTITRKGYQHLPKGKGLREFVTVGGDVLTKGGVVTLAINASRRDHLDLDDPQKPIGYLIAALQGIGIQEYGFLLVSFSIKNAKSYAKKAVGGINIGKPYSIKIGRYYPLSDLLARSSVAGKVSLVDTYLRKEMAK